MFLHQAVKNVYIHYTQSPFLYKSFFVIANSNPTQPAFLPFLFLLISLFLFSFFSPHLSLYLPSLPSPPLPPTLPYPPLSQVSAYPALPCPIPAIRYNYLYPKKEKNKSQKTKKEKDYLSLQSVKSSIYHITITITHLFSGERGRGGGEGGGKRYYCTYRYQTSKTLMMMMNADEMI